MLDGVLIKMDQKQKILAVVGPTASGKSALALELAKRLDGEIICCDSMQIYKQMNIGTAKPTSEEMAQLPHHLFDFVSPRESFSCADYVDLAEKTVDDILSRGKLPVFCGGTGLYLDRFLNSTDFEETEINEEYRKEMGDYAREHGNEALHQLLCQVDPESAQSIHPNNVKRVIRALEIFNGTGRKKSELDRESRTKEAKYEAIQIGLRYVDREKLYERINLRVDKMLEAGLLDETCNLERVGAFESNLTAAQAIGYKELLTFIRGEKSYEEAVEDLKRATRRYSKRQMTWFSSHGKVFWIDADGKMPDQIVDEAYQIYLNNK